MPISISSSTTSTRRLAEADLVIWLEYPCAIESELNECWLNRKSQASRARVASDGHSTGRHPVNDMVQKKFRYFPRALLEH
jgi:hypothetical protein